MKAELLITDENDSSCLIEIYYNRVSFGGWSSYAKPIGPSTTGDCSRFGVVALHLEDKNSNLLNLDWLGLTLVPDAMMIAGNSGKGWVKSKGFLKTGDINWIVWNTRRSGSTGDDWIPQTG